MQRQPSPQSPLEALFNPFDSELKFSDDSACEFQAAGSPWHAGRASCSVLLANGCFASGTSTAAASTTRGSLARQFLTHSSGKTQEGLQEPVGSCTCSQSWWCCWILISLSKLASLPGLHGVHRNPSALRKLLLSIRRYLVHAALEGRHCRSHSCGAMMLLLQAMCAASAGFHCILWVQHALYGNAVGCNCLTAGQHSQAPSAPLPLPVCRPWGLHK